MSTYPLSALTVGQSASFAKTVTESDVSLYAGLTGDLNPAHVNEEYARATPFGGRIVHGMFSAGLVSAVLGMQLPGTGTIYLGQELRFLKPVHIGDTVTATATVLELLPEKNRVTLTTVCTNQKGETVLDGVATVRPPQE